MYGQLVALLDDSLRLVELREIELRIYPLSQQVERERDDVDVPRPLAIPEQSSFDAVGTSHQSELCGRDGGAAVVVRMDGQNGCRACGEVASEPFNPVRIDVWRKVLDRRRQVDDHLLVGRRQPFRRDRLADLEREVELRVVEALGRVLEDNLAVGRIGELAAKRGGAYSQLAHAGLIEPEDDAPLSRRRRVVEVHDRARNALERLKGSLDQLGTRLCEHRDREIVRDQLFVDQHPDEVEIRLRRGRKADLDLLE